jgi:hypothetical protein
MPVGTVQQRAFTVCHGTSKTEAPNLDRAKDAAIIAMHSVLGADLDAELGLRHKINALGPAGGDVDLPDGSTVSVRPSKTAAGESR